MGLIYCDEALTMSRFYAGCRVRIKWSETRPELNGSVGTIVGRSDAVNEITGYRGDWEVSPDAWGSSISPEQDMTFVPLEEQLEPATDQNDKIDWEDCIWAPEHLREKV